LVTDFVNLKIKPAQFFKGAHKNEICVHLFIEVNATALYCALKNMIILGVH
jgi:hypothetical protein